MPLRLPNGDTITPGDIILFEGYPYRYVDAEGGFTLSPLYWGDSDLDLWFDSVTELDSRWGSRSRGVLTEPEWRIWLSEARDSPRFSTAELDYIEGEVLPPPGLVDRVRRFLARL